MVSGFLTSPLDQVRMESAVARPILSCSKLLTSSIDLVTPLAGAACVFFVGAPLGAADVDTELFGRAEHVLIQLAHLDLLARVGENLDVQAQTLHFLDEHLETFWDPGLGDVFSLDDRLVDLDPAEHVVGLDGEQLLQGVGSAVGLEGPHLHLAETLAAELGLSSK